jgi:hypothetical protein
VRRRGGRVAASPSHALDLDREAHELAGAEAAPVGVRAQGERDAAEGLVAHVDDFGPHVSQRPRWAHELQVPVDAVRSGKRLEQPRSQQSAADPAGRGLEARDARRRDRSQVSVHLFIDYTGSARG